MIQYMMTLAYNKTLNNTHPAALAPGVPNTGTSTHSESYTAGKKCKHRLL